MFREKFAVHTSLYFGHMSYNISNTKKIRNQPVEYCWKESVSKYTIKLIDPEVLEQADENNFRNSLDSTIISFLN
jgi:hypothetical protein